MIFDVFNGDADGMCALHQLRLDAPQDSVLVTGVKRDLALLKRVPAQAGDRVTVLDVTVDKNRASLLALLDAGVAVRWFDHHNPGELPAHPSFEAHIDTAADVCTSLLVDRHLNGRHRAWAVAAAYGDNLHGAALKAVEPLGLAARQIDVLRELGECLNYNAYGDSIDDLHFAPAELYRRLRPYADPFAFVAEAPEFTRLKEGYAADMALARGLTPLESRPSGTIYRLPDAAWARRVSGVYANELAQRHPTRAHALITRSPSGHYVVSVRAPVANPTGADTLCMGFPSGGGRKAAAGINNLPESELERFAREFFSVYA